MNLLVESLSASGLLRPVSSLNERIESHEGQIQDVRDTLAELNSMPSGDGFPVELEPKRLAAIEDYTQREAALLASPPVGAILWERNYISALAQVVTPNDIVRGENWQWHFLDDNIFPQHFGILAQRGWAIRRDTASIVIAIMDSGIDYVHPDLSANMRRNFAEVQNNNLDDDGNGYIDDHYGVHIPSGTGAPNPDELRESWYHGTKVASVAGAVTNNGLMMAGTAWSTKFLNVAVATRESSIFPNIRTSNSLRGLEYVRDLWARGVKVRVTNMSFGLFGVVSVAVCRAIENMPPGMLFVQSAGNEGERTGHPPHFTSPGSPSGCLDRNGRRLKNVISVAASTHLGTLSNVSNFGTLFVDVAAPGSSIPVLVRDHRFVRSIASTRGTSFSAPMVSAIAALVGAGNSMTAREVRERIMNTIRPSLVLRTLVNRPGVVNLCFALKNYECQCCKRAAGIGCTEPEIEAFLVGNPCVPYSSPGGGGNGTPTPTPTPTVWSGGTVAPVLTPTRTPTPTPTRSPTPTRTVTPTRTPTPVSPNSTPTAHPTATGSSGD